MSSLVSILVLGAIYLIVYVVKSLGATPAKDGGHVFNEGFPVIDTLEPEKGNVAPVHSAVPVKERRQKDGDVVRPVLDVMRPVTEKSAENHAAGERLVKLNSKSDAKRAFIYSEIFNRKY